MPQTTQAGLATLTPNYHADVLREQLWPTLMFRQFGTLAEVPHGRLSVKISRWTPVLTINKGVTIVNASLCTVSEAIAETASTTLSGVTLSAGTISGEPVLFGGWRKYTDKMMMATAADFEQAAIQSLVKELGFRLDRRARTQIQASGRTMAVGNSPLGTVKLTTLGANEKQLLSGRNQARFQTIMDAHNNQRWEDGNYVMLAHPLPLYDLTVDASGTSPGTAFVSLVQYGNPELAYRGEIGYMFGTRVVATTALSRVVGTAATSAANGISPGASCFQSFVFAPDSFYNIEHADGSLEVIHHAPGSGGASGDPLNRIGSIAVKVWYDALANVDSSLTTATFGGNNRLLRVSHATSTSVLN